MILTVKLARLDFTQILIFWQSVKILHLFRQGRQEKHLNLICLATSEGQLSKCFRGIKSKVVLSLYKLLPGKEYMIISPMCFTLGYLGPYFAEKDIVVELAESERIYVILLQSRLMEQERYLG